LKESTQKHILWYDDMSTGKLTHSLIMLSISPKDIDNVTQKRQREENVLVEIAFNY